MGRRGASIPDISDDGKDGKGSVTVRQVLSHQAGLCAIDEPMDLEVLGDPEPPVADFRWTGIELSTLNPVQFFDESTGRPTSWSWTRRPLRPPRS